MNIYVLICSAIVAVIGLMKFAVDDAHRWWRLAVLILIIGVIILAILWMLRNTGGVITISSEPFRITRGA
jgi:uncharacterized membrane protein (Fun14 family)